MGNKNIWWHCVTLFTFIIFSIPSNKSMERKKIKSVEWSRQLFLAILAKVGY